MVKEPRKLVDSPIDNSGIFSESLVHSDPEYIKNLLDQNIFSSENDKRSKVLELLGLAIKNHKIEVACMLLEYGVCIASPVNNLNLTALQLAVKLRDKPMIDLLLKYKSDPKVTDSKFQSLLHLVLENATPDIETSQTHKEVQEKVIVIMKMLIDLGLDVNKKNNRNETPLYYAVRRRMIKVVKFLVEHGAKVNCVTKKGESIAFALVESDVKIRESSKTLIHFRQAMADSVNLLKYLISVGLDIDIKTKKNKCVLELTTESNAKHMIKILLEHTNDVFFKTKKKQTILHLLFTRNSVLSQRIYYDDNIAMKLIDKGAPIDVHDVNGDTPFHIAAIQGRIDVLCQMIDRGVNIHVRDKTGTPIWRIAMDTLIDSAFEDRIIALISQGVDVNRENQWGMTPVETAATYRHKKLLKILIECGADVNIVNHCKENLLHIISRSVIEDNTSRFDESTVDLLISRGCNLHAYNINGMTPLHVACRLENNFEVVKALIKHGANINCRVKSSKQSPLHLAASIGDVDIVKYLIELGAELDCRDKSLLTPLHLAAREGYTDVVKILAELGANVDARSSDQLTPILTALKYNYRNRAHSIVDTLIKSGADIHCRLTETNFTPLHDAVMRNNVNVVKCLLKNGANVSCQDNPNKLAPLHVAVEAGNVLIVSMLIEKGADVNCREKSMLTPLHVAVENDNEAIIRCLVKSGANINDKEITGMTPLHLAIRYEHKCTETLLELGARTDLKDSAGYTPLHEALDCENRVGFNWLIEFRMNVNDIGTPENEEFLQVMESRSIADSFIRHLINLMAIDFPVSEMFQRFLDMDKPHIKSMYQDCLNEVALLKKPVIKGDKESSLYNLLHMHPYKRYPFYKKKEFKFIKDRKARRKSYPFYCDIIMASYRETMSYEKILLTVPARLAWYNLTKIYLPVICVNFILDHLDLDDLNRMIEGDKRPKRKKSPTSTTMKSTKKLRKSKD